MITGTGSVSDRHDLLEGKIKDILDPPFADPDEQESAEDQVPNVFPRLARFGSPQPGESQKQSPHQFEDLTIAIRELKSEIRHSRPNVTMASTSLWHVDFGFWMLPWVGLAALLGVKSMEPRKRIEMRATSLQPAVCAR
jgi:hypothetical protein